MEDELTQVIDAYLKQARADDEHRIEPVRVVMFSLHNLFAALAESAQRASDLLASEDGVKREEGWDYAALLLHKVPELVGLIRPMLAKGGPDDR